MQRVTQVHDVVVDLAALLSRWDMRLEEPVVLSDAGNLTLWLRPYPLVARVATLFAGDDANFWGAVWQRELRVADHLTRHGIPLVAPATVIPAGPHRVAGTWMTLWDYAEPREGLPDPADGVAMVRALSHAMQSYPERQTLPPWGAWTHVTEAVEHLRLVVGQNVQAREILREVERVRQQLQGEPLVPAHGDAHRGNLLPTEQGWRWIDFEDVSLMPQYWDLASFVANTALFDGVDHPLVAQARELDDVRAAPEAFWWTVRARVVMSLSTNMGLALMGHGDQLFAFRQWERWPTFLRDWTRSL